MAEYKSMTYFLQLFNIFQTSFYQRDEQTHVIYPNYLKNTSQNNILFRKK